MEEQPRQPYMSFRLKRDLSVMLEELLQVLGQKSPDYLDPIVRTQIENDHKAHRKAINALRDAKEKHRKQRDEDPEMANDLGGEG